MSGETPVLFAAGPRGVFLNLPAGTKLVAPPRVIASGEPLSATVQRARVSAALNGPQTLRDTASGKRRAVILVGDLSRPAPYEHALLEIVAELVKADIRPSRISFIACPGGSGPLLGRAAIQRYGEELCANHEMSAWSDPVSPGEVESADLRIAVASVAHGKAFESFLPPSVKVDYSVALELGQRVQLDIEAVRTWTAHPPVGSSVSTANMNRTWDVWLTSGGGAPWEQTLEEALLSLHAPPCSARHAVLVFSGEEGSGSAFFTRDMNALLQQAEEALNGGNTLGAPSSASAFDPAATLADALRRYETTILYSRTFCEHADGEDLGEQLAALPLLSQKLKVLCEEAALWAALKPGFGVFAQPLGWREAN